MKFASIVCLIGAASATVGADCSSDKTVCASNECCGTGKKDTSVNDNTASTDVTVCQVSGQTKYVKDTKAYTFTCNTVSSTGSTGASQLALSGAAILAASYYMA